MEPSGLSAVRRGHPQRLQYGQRLVKNGALRAVSRQARAPTETPVWTDTCTEWSPLGCQLSAVRRGHPQRLRYGQTLVKNGTLRAVSRQARAPTETPVRTDTCTEWSRLGCQPSGEGTHRDLGTDRHLYRMEPSGQSALRRGHPQRPRYGQTLLQNGALWAVSRQARAHTEIQVRTDTCTEWSPPGCQARATETLVRTDTCTEWSPPGCQPSGEGTHRDPGTDRHLYRMEPSGLSAVRRGHIQRPRYGQTLVQNGTLRAVKRGLQRPWYGQTLVQNGALRAVSRQSREPTESPVRTDTCTEWSPLGCQARAHTETPVRTDTCTEWSPLGCQPSGEGTHRDPSTDRHLYRMELSAIRRGHPQRPLYGLSALRRGHPQRPQYGQTLVQKGAVSHQERAPTETPVRAVSPQARAPTVTPVPDRNLYRMEPSGLSSVRRGLQRPRYGQTLVQNGALRAVSCQARAPTETPVWAVSRQARAPTETPVWTDTCIEWSPPGCQPSGKGTHGDPGTGRRLYRMEPSGLSAVRR
ncbi:hypothetical protein NDU88_006635 [Pleurodeles waltl]|uniref:Uncharacterized protein n=1 Tax=Pleurodeles waltl TaxID=8319 RepID=A0AAV7L7K4_PLEWA|nr:hypothetical protein NDU88_006635 [Pleurodeles waltl]